MSEIEQRIRVARAAFARTLLPEGEQIAELLESGINLSRIRNLYPEAFEGIAPLLALPRLIDSIDLPSVQELLDEHKYEIGDMWRDAYHEANSHLSQGELLVRDLLTGEWREQLFKSSEVAELQEQVTKCWVHSQTLRFSQMFLKEANVARSRHVRHLLICIAYFWKLSGEALHVDPKYGMRILRLFEPLLQALADAKAQQLHAV